MVRAVRWGLVVAAMSWAGTQALADLFVSDNFGSQILRFNESTGAFLSTAVPAGSGGLDGATGMMIGPDGLLWVTSQNKNEILRYDAYDGTFVNAFVSSAQGNNSSLNGPSAIKMVNGEVWVSNFFGNSIERFNPMTGQNLGPATTGGTLAGVTDFAFSHTGDLYVSSFQTNSVLKYNGQTREFVEALPSSPALVGPATIAFNNDQLHVASLLGQTVQRFNAQANAFETFATPPSFGENNPFPSDLLFRNGQLLVTLTGLQSIAGFDAITGAPNGFFATAPTLQVPGRMLIAPVWIPGDANGDGRVSLIDFSALRANFGTGTTRRQGDFDGNQLVDLKDFSILRSNFGRSNSLVPEPLGLGFAAGLVGLLVASRVKRRTVRP